MEEGDKGKEQEDEGVGEDDGRARGEVPGEGGGHADDHACHSDEGRDGEGDSKPLPEEEGAACRKHDEARHEEHPHEPDAQHEVIALTLMRRGRFRICYKDQC